MRGAHGAKPYATSAGTNATCDDSAAAEAPAAKVTAATKASTAMPSRPCYRTERHGYDADYQRN
jgi:hypothetical protein